MALWVRSRADAAKAKKPAVRGGFRSPRTELGLECCWGCNRLRLGGRGDEGGAGSEADSATDARGEGGAVGEVAEVEEEGLVVVFGLRRRLEQS